MHEKERKKDIIMQHATIVTQIRRLNVYKPHSCGCDVCDQIAVVERQVFDFFGFMWTCIVVNFVQIIVVIAGLFGVCQDRAKIVVVVSISR